MNDTTSADECEYLYQIYCPTTKAEMDDANDIPSLIQRAKWELELLRDCGGIQNASMIINRTSDYTAVASVSMEGGIISL